MLLPISAATARQNTKLHDNISFSRNNCSIFCLKPSTTLLIVNRDTKNSMLLLMDKMYQSVIVDSVYFHLKPRAMMALYLHTLFLSLLHLKLHRLKIILFSSLMSRFQTNFYHHALFVMALDAKCHVTFKVDTIVRDSAVQS